jgi:hypothetical protein
MRVIGALKVARGYFAAHSRYREQSRRPHRPAPTLTLPRLRPLAGEEGRGSPATLVGATTLWVRPRPERPLSPCVIKSDDERFEFVDFIARNPEAGDLIPASVASARSGGVGTATASEAAYE